MKKDLLQKNVDFDSILSDVGKLVNDTYKTDAPFKFAEDVEFAASLLLNSRYAPHIRGTADRAHDVITKALVQIRKQDYFQCQEEARTVVSSINDILDKHFGKQVQK